MKLYSRRGHGPTMKLHRNPSFGEVSTLAYPSLGAEIAGLPTIGTGRAINYPSLGVAAVLPSVGNRGGALNRSDRESVSLTKAQVANLTAAESHAKGVGLPLNRMITIHWETAGVPLERMAKATGRFIDLFTKALARNGSKTAWIWVHEGGEDKGGHCHLLAHVPAHLVPIISGLQKGWLRKISGNNYRASVIHSKPIGGRLGLDVSNEELHAINLERVVSYVLKGADAEAASLFGLTKLEAGGLIVGKRCGTSQNIGAAARQTAK